MNFNSENIKALIEETVRDLGFFLIDLNLRGHGRNQVIEVYIDGKNYINADDCAKVSHELNSKLQNNLSPEESFRLDVSSPGTDRPLKYIEQFPKHLNKKFELTFKLNNELKKTEAELIGIQNNELTFQTKDKRDLIINFKDLVKAKVLLSFL